MPLLEGSPLGTTVKAAPILIFALAIGITIAFWPSAPDAEPSMVSVRVDGPNEVWYVGNVTADTVYESMVLIATQQGWSVALNGRPGECNVYVKEIRGVGEEGAGGWVFEIKREGNWTGALYSSADCTPLQDGDLVWWHWSSKGEYEATKDWE